MYLSHLHGQLKNLLRIWGELLSRIRGATSEKEIDLTPEKLDESIVNSLKILGKEKVNELIKKCGF